jgi:hypothetical protein
VSVAVPSEIIAPPRPRLSALRDFRLIPRLETYPSIVAFAQTLAGKALLLTLFGLGLYYATYLHYLSNPRWKVQICFLVAATAFPKYRRIVLALGTIAWACGIWWLWAVSPQIVQAGASLVLAGIIFWAATRFPDSWLRRRPVLTLLS